MPKSIEELERKLDNLKKDKAHWEEIYDTYNSLYEAYSIDIDDLKEKISSLRKEINIVQNVTQNEKDIPPEINIDDVLKDISSINSQIDNLFEKVKKIIEFRQNQMKNISDEIEGVENQ